MTTAAVSVPSTEVRARRAGFLADLITVAGRAVRSIPREPEAIIPALVVPVFFYIVNVGALSDLTNQVEQPGFSYKAFQLPMAIVFAVTGISRAATLVTDIQDGYFDRLTLTPIRRPALLLGLMVADFVLVVALCIPVLILGFILGVGFETGPLGIVVFILMAAAWGLTFTGFPYAIALKTGNPAAVNSSFLLFFPFAFLTTGFVPEQYLSGWLATLADWNPVTYLLAGMRSLLMVGWDWTALGQAFLAIAIVGAVSFTLALLAFRGRVKSGA